MPEPLWNAFAVIGLSSVIASTTLVLLVLKCEYQYKRHVRRVQENRASRTIQ